MRGRHWHHDAVRSVGIALLAALAVCYGGAPRTRGGPLITGGSAVVRRRPLGRSGAIDDDRLTASRLASLGGQRL